MSFFNLETALGNFWLESNGKKVHFDIVDMEEWYGERYNNSDQCKVSVIKRLNPILTEKERETFTELFVFSDMDQSDWEFDSAETGEDLFNFSFINRKNNVVLGIGAAWRENDQDWFYYSDDKSRNSVYLRENQTKEKEEAIIFGYKNLNKETIRFCKFALSIREFNQLEELTTDGVDLSVFLTL